MASKRLKQWIWENPKWPQFTWDAGALSTPLAAARRAQGEVAGMARLLDANADLQAQLEVLTNEGIATSAIEGEKFDPNSLRSSLARRLGLPTAGLPPATRSVEGLVEVLLDATRDFNEPLQLKRLNSWQAALFPTGRSGLHEIRVGKLRGEDPMQIVSGPIGRERVHYEAPPRARLDEEMKTFLAWFNNTPKEIDALLRAGLAHAWFEVVHPYEDGNGRVGRALLDRALAQDENRSTRLYSMSARFESRARRVLRRPWRALNGNHGCHSVVAMVPGPGGSRGQVQRAHSESRDLQSAVLGAPRACDPQRATEEGTQRLARCRTAGLCRRNDEQEVRESYQDKRAARRSATWPISWKRNAWY